MERNNKIWNVFFEKNKNIKFLIFYFFLWYFVFVVASGITNVKCEINQNPIKFMRYLVNDMFVNMLLFCVISFIGKVGLYMYSILQIIIVSINYWTVIIINKRFTLSDLFVVKTAFLSSKTVRVQMFDVIHFLILIMYFVGLFILLKKVNYKKQSRTYKIVFCFIFSLLLCTSINNYYNNNNFSFLFNQYLYSYSENFYLIENFSYLKKPNNYKNNIKKIKKIEKEETTYKAEKSNPVVIQIMSEALYDFDGIDYMPFTKKIKSGNVHTNVYGNKTNISELESLSSINSKSLDYIDFKLYTSYANSSMDTTVKMFKNNGYKTIGVHPGSKAAYNRTNVWNTFGFDEMYFDKNFDNKTYLREYISDATFFNKIIDLINSNKNTPLYLYGISIQNHGPYESINVKNTIKNGSKDLNEYVSLQNITDNDFKIFVEKLNNMDRDVILLYYGDHQPMMPNNDYEMLHIENKYETPYILWSNNKTLKHYNDVNMSYLPIIIMDAAEIKYSNYFQYVKLQLEKNPLVSTNDLYISWMYYQLKEKH